MYAKLFTWNCSGQNDYQPSGNGPGNVPERGSVSRKIKKMSVGGPQTPFQYIISDHLMPGRFHPWFKRLGFR